MVSIESEEFTKIIKNLSVLDGKSVAIETKDNCISFSSAGEIGKGAQTLEYQTKGNDENEEGDSDKLRGATSIMEEVTA